MFTNALILQFSGTSRLRQLPDYFPFKRLKIGRADRRNYAARPDRPAMKRNFTATDSLARKRGCRNVTRYKYNYSKKTNTQTFESFFVFLFFTSTWKIIFKKGSRLEFRAMQFTVRCLQDGNSCKPIYTAFAKKHDDAVHETKIPVYARSLSAKSNR